MKRIRRVWRAVFRPEPRPPLDWVHFTFLSRDDDIKTAVARRSARNTRRRELWKLGYSRAECDNA